MQALDASFHILHRGEMYVPHPVQSLPGHVALGSTMRPVEQVLLWESLAPSLVGNFEQGAVVSEYGGVGLEDDEATVEVVGPELVFILLFCGREAVLDSYMWVLALLKT
jgi:hypothetical protein